MKNPYCFILITIALFLCHTMSADLRLAGVFADKAVLQQGVELPVWGVAKPLGKVVVEFDGKSVSTIAGNDGKWSVLFPALTANVNGQTLLVHSCGDSITREDILVGEVWLISGQSNMEWRVKNGVVNKEDELKDSDYSRFRMLTVPASTAAQPLDVYDPYSWRICDKTNASEFSAIGFFFGRELSRKKQVPVGILNASRGATDIEAWIGRDALEQIPFMKDRLLQVETDTLIWNQYVRDILNKEKEREQIGQFGMEGIQKQVHLNSYDDSSWLKRDFPIRMPDIDAAGYWGIVWLRNSFSLAAFPSEGYMLELPVQAKGNIIFINGKEIARNVKSEKIVIPDTILRKGENILAVRMYVNWGDASVGLTGNASVLTKNGDIVCDLMKNWKFSLNIEQPVAQWNNYYCKPGVSFNAMVAPLSPYAIKGVLWYQGENNAGKFAEYATLQSTLISQWREMFENKHLPFLYVQLASFYEQSLKPKEKDTWASFRDAQKSVLNKMQHVAMVTAVDAGEKDNIHPANKQIVAKRLLDAALNLAYDEDVNYKNPVLQKIRTRKKRIELIFNHADEGLYLKNDSFSFALADDSGQLYWVKAEVKKNKVILPCIDSNKITAVQYAWQSNPNVTLYSGDGIPALPFYEKIKP